jgi:hypothetical protein
VEFWHYRLIPIQAPPSLGVKIAKSVQSRSIPTELNLEQFRQFALPHLTVGRRGPAPKPSLHALFNYILKLLYLGCQWKELSIAKDAEERPEIHYTRALSGGPCTVYRFLQQKHPELGSTSALDALKRGRVQAVRQLAEGIGHGAFS